MVNLTRELRFETQAPARQLLPVLRALEPQLVHSIKSIPNLEHRGYYVSSQTGALHNVTPEELTDAVAHLEGVTTIKVQYSNYGDGEQHTFQLWLDNYLSDVVDVRCDISATNSPSALGLIETIKNRFKIEIARQNDANWMAEPLDLPDLSAMSTGAPAALPLASSRKSSAAQQRSPTVSDTGDALQPKVPTFWHTLTTHPLPVTVIGGIVASGLIFLVGLAIVKFQPTQSPSSTTTSVTTKTTAPSTSATPSEAPSPPKPAP